MNFEQLKNLEMLTPFYEAGKIGSDFVAAHLNITNRHARRILKGNIFVAKREAWNRYSEEVRQFIIEQKKDHAHHNCQWISEIASDRFAIKISQSTVWRILHSEGMFNLRSVNRTVRERFEAEKSGDIVQMDTTWGYWLGKRKLCLILLLDDHSRYILDYNFVQHDSAANNMALIKRVVKSYGSFKLLYTDNASFFKAIRHNRSMHQNHHQIEYESDITRACREAGIVHVTHKPYQPQGKGKIERLFRFIQERFINDLDDDELPLWLINKKFASWVDWYNTKHINRTTHQTPKERFNSKEFKPLPKEKNLDDIFCFKDTRKVDKCNQFSYEGSSYTIPKDKCMIACRVDLHVNPIRSIRVWHNGEFICELPIITKN